MVSAVSLALTLSILELRRG